MVPPASPGAPWTESILYNPLQHSSWTPCCGVTVGLGGVLYGIANGDAGGLFALAPPATPGRPWVETVIGAISSLNGVVIGAGPVLFGATDSTVYSLTPPPSPSVAWTLTVLLNIPYEEGHGGPNPGPLTLGENNTLYGTTGQGGPSKSGTAYVLKPPTTSGGAWTEILLHTFTGSDGANPTGLEIGSGGVLYGTTELGGAYGTGTVFALTE
jgi:hypothetical protein